MKDSPKVNVLCTLKRNHIIRQLFFKDCVINADSYLGMLQNYFILQLEKLNLKYDAGFQ